MRNTKLILRHDSTANWNANGDVVLLKAELGLEFLEDDTVRIKIGDGVTPWKNLKYFDSFTEIIQKIEALEKRENSPAFDFKETLILNCGGAAEDE